MVSWKLIIEIVGVCCALIALIVMCVITFRELPKLGERTAAIKAEYEAKNSK